MINDYTKISKGAWVWDLVVDGDNVYNCDILMDKIALDTQRADKKDYESDMIYFGMRDKTRKESIDFQNRRIAQTMDQAAMAQKSNLPDCEEDYK